MTPGILAGLGTLILLLVIHAVVSRCKRTRRRLSKLDESLSRAHRRIDELSAASTFVLNLPQDYIHRYKYEDDYQISVPVKSAVEALMRYNKLYLQAEPGKPASPHKGVVIELHSQKEV